MEMRISYLRKASQDQKTLWDRSENVNFVSSQSRPKPKTLWDRSENANFLSSQRIPKPKTLWDHSENANFECQPNGKMTENTWAPQ
jgi:hypothetical protein